MRSRRGNAGSGTECELTMANRNSHPGTALLEDFALGRLGASEIERIGSHLETCPACLRIVEAAPEDRLVSLLKRTAERPSPPDSRKGES
jgi:hypothetical protein